MNISSLVKHTSFSGFYYFVCKYEHTSTKLRNTVSDSPLSFADPRKVPNVLSLLYHSFLT